MDITGIIVTIYDSRHPEYTGEPISLENVSFIANRFPKHQLRVNRFPGGLWWTTELHPPELGNDSAMQLGLET